MNINVLNININLSQFWQVSTHLPKLRLLCRVVCIGILILVTRQDQGILEYGTCRGEMSYSDRHGDPVHLYITEG